MAAKEIPSLEPEPGLPVLRQLDGLARALALLLRGQLGAAGRVGDAGLSAEERQRVDHFAFGAAEAMGMMTGIASRRMTLMVLYAARLMEGESDDALECLERLERQLGEERFAPFVRAGARVVEGLVAGSEEALTTLARLMAASPEDTDPGCSRSAGRR